MGKETGKWKARGEHEKGRKERGRTRDRNRGDGTGNVKRGRCSNKGVQEG